MEFLGRRFEAWAGNIIRLALGKAIGVSQLPSGEAVALDVVPGVLQADVRVPAVGVGDEEARVQILVAAVEAGRLSSG